MEHITELELQELFLDIKNFAIEEGKSDSQNLAYWNGISHGSEILYKNILGLIKFRKNNFAESN